MSEELWVVVCNIVQEAVTKTIPKRKEHKKAKWLSEEALSITEERREAKGQEQRERYYHLNAESQRLAGRDKKAFLNEQSMGKTKDLFKKTGDTKGKFHARMGMIKHRNSNNLTEAEEVKRSGKNTQKNYTKKS